MSELPDEPPRTRIPTSFDPRLLHTIEQLAATRGPSVTLRPPLRRDVPTLERLLTSPPRMVLETPREPGEEDERDPDERGDVELGAVIGEGGMGIVHVARQRSLDREVAVKLPRASAAGAHSSRLLLREARITGALEHPAVIPVHSVGVDGRGLPFMVMKKVEGVVWRELLADPSHPRWAEIDGDRLAFHIGILIDICHAIELAHSRGVVHRDLKPHNVMIGSYGEVYVLDWGIAHKLGEPQGEALAGTLAYMAPEMTLDEEPITARTDIYLLGAILHEVLTGKTRHTGSNAQQLLASIVVSEPYDYDEGVPTELAEIANRATAREPEERFAGVAELRRALSGFLVHRASLDLAKAGQKKLAAFEELARGEGGARSGDLPRLRRLFNESSFAFREALRIWEGNAEADEGLRRSLLRMIEVEIEREDPESASALLAELRALGPGAPEGEEPKEEQTAEALGARIEALVEKREREAARIKELEKLAHESDPLAFARQTGRFLFGFSAFAALLIGGVLAWMAESKMLLTWPFTLAWTTGFVVVAWLVYLTGSRKIFPQEHSRKLLLFPLVAATGYLPMRLYAWWLGMALLTELNFENVLNLLMSASLVIFGGRRYLILLLFPPASALAMNLVPRYYLTFAFVFFIGSVFTFAWLAFGAGAQARGGPPEAGREAQG